MKPEYIFEASWEVCNKVGGIYTVLSTRAKTLQDELLDHVIFVGPDLWHDKDNPLFVADDTLFADWRERATSENLHVRAGRWNIPGHPIAILVDHVPYYAYKNAIYTDLWCDFQVDSLHAYGDYDESSMFSYAAGRVVESFYAFYLYGNQRVVFQAHEWMTSLGMLYVRKHVPAIATIFTTHATTIGRSIAGNGKELYRYLFAYNGTQMAQELNVESKHSVERAGAWNADCFTTVSQVTADECLELLDRRPDQVLPNGFEMDFVPKGPAYTSRRHAARKRLFAIASALTGTSYADDTLVVSTSGRYEWRNKGIDVFTESLCQLGRQMPRDGRRVLAIIKVPAWHAGPREDLQFTLAARRSGSATGSVGGPLSQYPWLTHWLHEPDSDPVVSMLRRYGLANASADPVHVIFTPCYLDGDDGIFDMSYYDFLIGMDLCIYPSYYEPWGYTPLESIAFHIPCITTSLSGFGRWANDVKGGMSTLRDGALVVPRDDTNYHEVCQAIQQAIMDYVSATPSQVKAMRAAATTLAAKADWAHFITYYHRAYDIAFEHATQRLNQVFMP